MNVAGDPFGAALLDAYSGGAGRHSIERDDGFLDWMDATAYFEPPPARILDALSCLQGLVLDVGCGPGTPALQVASLGCEVLGIDPSPGAIEVCRRRGVEAVVGRLGAAELPHRQFDAVVMLGNGLGLLASPEQAVGHLRWLAGRCVPGARLIGEGFDVRQTANPVHLAYHERQRVLGRPIGAMKIRVGFRDAVGEWFPFWHLTPDELHAVVERTPWTVESLDGGPTYIAVLRRR